MDCKSVFFLQRPTFSFLFFSFSNINLFIYSFKFFYFLFFYFTILYWFCHTSACIHHRCTRVPHPEPPSPYQPSGSSQCTIPKLPVFCIEPGLAILRKLWYIYTMEYYSAIRKNTFESVLMRWTKLEYSFALPFFGLELKLIFSSPVVTAVFS